MMRTLRVGWPAWVAVLAIGLGASVAQAQDAAPPAEGAQPAEPAPADAVPVTQQAVTAPAPAARQYARPRPAPPIMVAVLPADRVPEEVATAAREALVAQLTPMANGRMVRALAAAPIIAALAGCADDACVGAQLASAGVQAGVLLRIARRGRGLVGTLTIHDPVSGTSRTEAPIEGAIPTDVAEVPAALAAMSAQLTSAMPTAPARAPTLLVTTTADGALVTIDGEDIGESPVGPIEIADGEHEVIVRLAGYQSYRGTTRIAPGGRARIDATLRSLSGESGATGDSSDPFAPSDSGDDDLLGQWWFWTAIGGGAALVIGIVIAVAVVASDSGPQTPGQPMGIPLPPIVGGM
ncbi:MAG: PEGA domain-containing protein [Sandaracinaceae bacterium]